MSSAAAVPSGSALSSEPRSRPGRPVKRRVFSAPPRHSCSGLPWAIDPARVDDGDLVGELLGLVHEVGGEDDGHPVGAQLADQLPGGAAGLRVEPGGRLVEEDQLGAADDGHGQGQPLLLAAGEPPVGGAAAAAEAEPLDQRVRRPAGGRAAWPCGGASRRRGRRSRRRRTGASRRSAGAARRVGDRVEAEDPHGAARRRGGSPRRSRCGGLARAVGAEDGGDGAVRGPSRSRPSTAVLVPYRLTRPRIWTAGSLRMPGSLGGGRGPPRGGAGTPGLLGGGMA